MEYTAHRTRPEWQEMGYYKRGGELPASTKNTFRVTCGTSIEPFFLR